MSEPKRTRGAAQSELAEKVGGPVVGFNPARISGAELALKRIRERRVGGVFVQDDIPLHVLDIILKGEYPRTTREDRFVRPGSPGYISKQFADLSGRGAADPETAKELARLEAMEAELNRRDMEEKIARQRAVEDALKVAEESQKKVEEEMLEKARAQREEWEKKLLEKELGEEREPSHEDATRVAELRATVALPFEIPDVLLDECRFGSDVMELIDFRKQFKDIDFDQSGSIDIFELKTAMEKMGMETTEQQVATLMDEGDESNDGQVRIQ